ncbi:MAG TPA: histidine kinase [Actinomycetota bacterium]|nr:histidine kinase [Actinomycetota bacterium]
MSGATRERPARWPWVVLAIFLIEATVGLALVVRNDEPVGEQVPFVFAFAMFGLVGAVITSREPRNRIGLLLIWGAGATAVGFLGQELATYLAVERGVHGGPLLVATAIVSEAGWILGILPVIFLLPALFPTGRPHSPRWRWLPWTIVALAVLLQLGVVFATPTFVGSSGEALVRNPLYLGRIEAVDAFLDSGWWFVALLVLSAASQVMRFRASRGTERQQIKWFSFAIAAFAVYLSLSEILGFSGIVESVLSGIAFALLPAAIGASILQYRLWDLDVVVKRAVVAGMLVVLAIGVYAAAVALIGSVAVAENRPAFIFGIALALGIAFRPVIRAARRVADRLVYGKRATPYEVLTDFSERVGTSYATEDVLPRMAQVLGEGAGAEVARIWLRDGASFRPAAAWPAGAQEVAPPSAEPMGPVIAGETVIEVRDKGEVLGALSVRMPASDPMSPTKEKLVRDLAAHAGLVLRNVRLVEELRASRQRLVAAQDEERRRLERNIHDGAQQQLVALAVKARLARQLTERDPSKASEMLEQIESETQVALEDLRDLARGIYPPLLADQGLVAAIEAQARKGRLGVTVDANGLGRFPADIEATVYFCALEALQNVAKYADAAHTVVHLTRANGDLSFEVVDDGRGFDPAVMASGSGLQGMADRLAAVGGSLEVRSAPGRGTTVTGHVPVEGD